MKHADVKKHLRIKGRVQGVGYRYFTWESATQLGLRGYVRNMWNGEVEVVVEGPRNLIERLIGLLREGPPLARVDDMAVVYQEASGEFSHFDIRRGS
ncbi:MAG: acylphosphatase [candidate division Zixibacteria bacterium]|nr:acylphosphatase [candidate division Zixibacteria bacterium]